LLGCAGLPAVPCDPAGNVVDQDYEHEPGDEERK
jgi:hypothetical protein